MTDARKMLDELLGARIPGTESTVRQSASEAVRLARENPIATGALALALIGTGPGRALAGTALRIGGLAAIGGLAWKAWQGYQQGNAPTEAPTGEAPAEIAPPPAGSDFAPEQAPQGEDAFARALIQAMIAAAHADGRIDAEERKRIGERSALAGFDDDGFLREALENPPSVEALAAAAQTDAQRVELYTAARLAVTGQSAAEQDFLDRLAAELKLPSALVEHVESTVTSMRN